MIRLVTELTARGYEVLMVSKEEQLEEGVVLAVADGTQPYVTWRWSARDGEPVMTAWGHYHGDLASAIVDFRQR